MKKMVLLTAVAVTAVVGAGAAPASQYTSAKITIKPAVRAIGTSNSQTILAASRGLFIVVK